MSLFRLDASFRTEGSASRAIADIVESAWREGHREANVTRRHVGTNPLPSTLWAEAIFARRTPEEDRTAEQRATILTVSALADEVLDADALLFAVPLYNFGVSQHFKTWVDVMITDPRLGPSAEPTLAGRPAVLAAIRGGAYGEGTPREGWDHSTPWIRRILQDVWGLDLKVVDLEFTLVGVNPALDEFKDLAATMRVDAERAAVEHGRHLAGAFAN
jgi:FMN-dependent NADH-azoreductase